MTKTKTSRNNKIIQIGSFVLAALFLAGGATKMAGLQTHVDHFTGWGFPLWLMYLVGVTEVGGALLLLSQKTRFVGATMLAATMVGAVATHVVAGELAQTPPAAVLFLATAALTYATREQLGAIVERISRRANA